MSAISCSRRSAERVNPFFEEWDTPFGVPPFDRIEDGDYLPAFERAMSLHEAEIDAIVANNDEPTFANAIEALDASGRMLADVSAVFEMVSSAAMNDTLRLTQERIMPMLTAHRDRIMQNEKLFARVRPLYERRGALELDSMQLRLLEKTYEGFVRAGALLEAPQRERLREINERLSTLSVRFGNNLLSENGAFRLELVSSDLDGLPSGVRDAAREQAVQAGLKDKFLFTLDKPSLIPFLTYATRRDLRERLYKAYLSRGNNGDGNDNKAIIDEIVRLRYEKARLLGYDDYASYVTAEQMAGTPRAAFELLDGMWDPARERANAELEAMRPLLLQDRPGARFESWDWWYYAEKVRKRDYDLDEEMLRPYLSLENVQSGIFFLANRLYGITFRPIAVPHYARECSAYEVLDSDASHLGVLYFDYHPRKGKSGGAWCGYFREQRYERGERVAPVVGIVCNFTPPTRTTPALLTVDETRTLFHEFGHALHFLFHDVRYRSLSEVEGDFVELPSQIMENWAFEPALVAQYATHYRTDEPMPDALLGKLRGSSLFNQGFMTTELLAAALSDLEIHTLVPGDSIDVNGFELEVLNVKRGLIPQIEPRYRYPYFAHIFSGGYSAGYYFYLWAEVLDKDAFDYFRSSGDPFDARIAAAFRREVLSRGGEADGMTLYRRFRGADPSPVPMLRSRGLWTEPEPEPEPEPDERPLDPYDDPREQLPDSAAQHNNRND